MTLGGQTGVLQGLCLAQGMLDPNTLENSSLVSSQGAWVPSSITKSMSKLAFLQSRSGPGGHEMLDQGSPSGNRTDEGLHNPAETPHGTYRSGTQSPDRDT